MFSLVVDYDPGLMFAAVERAQAEHTAECAAAQGVELSPVERGPLERVMPGDNYMARLLEAVKTDAIVPEAQQPPAELSPEELLVMQGCRARRTRLGRTRTTRCSSYFLTIPPTSMLE